MKIIIIGIIIVVVVVVTGCVVVVLLGFACGYSGPKQAAAAAAAAAVAAINVVACVACVVVVGRCRRRIAAAVAYGVALRSTRCGCDCSSIEDVGNNSGSNDTGAVSCSCG